MNKKYEPALALNQPLTHDSQGNIPSSAAPTLCKEQQDLLALIATGRNVFFTGSAGCGKSTVLKAAIKMLRGMNKEVYIVAPTGRAALQVDGRSTWSYMGWTPDFHKLPIEKLIARGFRKHIQKRFKDTDALIIDEISMVENHHLERMNICMKAAISWKDWQSNADAPAFGGVQVIVTGDFCQLPPVKPFEFCMQCGLQMIADDVAAEFNCPKNHGPFPETDKWAFKSTAWEEANFVHVNLQEIHRQKNEYFIKMLQKCRLGVPFSPQETATLMEHPCDVQKATKLLCTRREVALVNGENFDRLKTPKYEYSALDGFRPYDKAHVGQPEYTERFLDGTLVACRDQRLERRVTLRGGMLVVLQVNLDLCRGLVNGSQGIICGFEAFSPDKLPKAAMGKEAESIPPQQCINGEYARLKEMQIKQFMEQHQRDPRLAVAWPRVLFHNGQKRVIYASCVVNSVGDKEPYSLLHRTQIPLIAGWAMSVHKSQGMTLDRVIVNLSHAFEEGQVYVALSRATSLNGLKIEGSSSGLSTTGGNQDVQMFLKAKFGDKIFHRVREFSEYLAQDRDGEEDETKAERNTHRPYY
ncbi:atp-dependent dna helicase pif1 [Trichoderma arundinaceum]|uniref:ATP-dependent DNA helicase n=1 Tax=Trichoderma arundinaceum TaxID=490622 RepID=A0A395NH29_TRIAR|nr:atp-dependent dna helicase pif1 [Trichoderma arundinaceum]